MSRRRPESPDSDADEFSEPEQPAHPDEPEADRRQILRDISLDQIDDPDRQDAPVSPIETPATPNAQNNPPDQIQDDAEPPHIHDRLVAMQNAAVAQRQEPPADQPAPPVTLARPMPERSIDIQSTVYRPIAEGRLQFCRVLRRRESLGSSRVTYELFIEDANGILQPLLFARRLRGQPSCYLITPSDPAERGSRHHALGRVRSNFIGTAFTVYDGGADPNKAARPSVISQGASILSKEPDQTDPKPLRKELCAVVYVPNILGRKGPRKMTIIIPPISPDSGSVVIQPTEEKDTLLERHKNGNDHGLLVMHNKSPQWSEETQSYVLNFNGRVALASVKNFQVVHDQDLEYIVLQFGRVSEDTFTLDLRYPISLMQAFGIALTSLDAKLACE